MASGGKWIILDRDDTLIIDTGYISNPACVELLPQAAEGLRMLADSGYKFVVVTNQSGVGRGLFTENGMNAVNARLAEILEREGLKIEKFYCCTHAPEEKCSCRKPGVELVRRAQRELGFDDSQICCVIGDRICDTELARRLGVRSILLRGDNTEESARGTAEAESFLGAAKIVLEDKWGVIGMGQRFFMRSISEHIDTAKKMTALSGVVAEAALLMAEAVQRGGRIFFCGNGGSAADAQHLASELSGRFLKERGPIDGVALSCNVSAVTAIANDYSFDKVFSRQLLAHGRKDDVLVAISTSGGSVNIIQAAAAARSIGIKIIGMTGESGGELKNLADVLISVPSGSTPRVQEMHILIGHVLCESVESYIEI